jgi:hypothetical protein
VLIAFGEFAWAGGARTVAELPGHVEGFVAEWMTGRPAVRQGGRRIARQARGPIEQMLMVVADVNQLFIDPEECIDCDVCVAAPGRCDLRRGPAARRMAALHEDQCRLLRKQALAASPSVAREDELLAGETSATGGASCSAGCATRRTSPGSRRRSRRTARRIRARGRGRDPPCRASTTRTTAPARSGERRTDRRAAVGQAQHPLRKRARGR